MNCPTCGNEAKGKFCGKCGTPITAHQPDSRVAQIQDQCPSCGGPISPGKKFCGGCGHKLIPTEKQGSASAKFIDPVTATIGVVGAAVGAVATAAIGAVVNKPKPEENQNSEDKGVTELGKCSIKLELAAGMIARRVTEKEMELYASRDGVIVSPGTLLIVIADGRIVANLSGGSYALPMDRAKHIGGLVKAGTGNFLNKVINWFRRKDNTTEEQAISHREAETIRKAKHVSLVLVREGDFVLPFIFEELRFAGGVTSQVAITFLMKVGDAEALFKHAMVDRVMEQTLIEILKPRITAQLNRMLPSYRKENFVSGPELLDGLAPVLRDTMADRYPGISIVDLIEATTQGGQLDEIRKAAGEMYDARLKIDQNEELMALNNIARSQENRKRIDDAKNQSEMTAALGAIQDEAMRAGFASEEAMEIFKKEMLERIEIFDRGQSERSADRDQDSQVKSMQRSLVIDLMEIDQTIERDRAMIRGQMLREQSYHEHDRQKLDQELELRKKRLQELVISRDEVIGQSEVDKAKEAAKVATNRIKDEYFDERRDKETTYVDARREKDLDFDAKKRTQDIQLQSQSRAEKLKAMAELQALREQRESGAHARELEAERVKNEAELAKQRLESEADLQKTTIYAGMTFEQIMATNPNISAEAAKALAEKFKGDKSEELTQSREKDMEAERKRMEAMMDRMQQMAEASMKQTANIAAGQNAAHQKDLERVAKSADERGSEIVKSVEKTLQSTAQVFSADARAKGPSQAVKIVGTCKSCQAEIEKGQAYCPECGDKVE